jgi:hypothetical protein
VFAFKHKMRDQYIVQVQGFTLDVMAAECKEVVSMKQNEYLLPGRYP